MTDSKEAEQQPLKFYSNKICPFAQRAWLTLNLKNIPYEFIECSLSDKQDFFKDAYSKALGHDESNAGKVPIIYHDGKYIAESTIVARYLDYVFDDETKYGLPLLPSDKYQRAAVEILVDWFGSSGWIRSHYGILMNADKEQADKAAEEWKKLWKILNDRLSEFSDKGLYLPNNQVSLFEIVAYPFFERLITIKHFCGYDVYGKWLEENPRLKSWYETISNVEAVKKNKQADEFFIDGYKGYREKAEAKLKEEQAQKK